MASIPKHVQVGPYKIAVICDRAAVDRICREDEKNYLGRTWLHEQTVHVEPNQAVDALADTVLHEVLHCLLRTLCFDFGEDTFGVEERLVGTLTPLLLDTLRRNPQLIAFLLDPEKSPAEES